MSSSVGDSVLDFDLNFLHPTPDNTVVNASERRKSIFMVKKKTISADTLIRDFYAKKEALDQAEKELLSAKEECKQTCIQYQKSQDAYAHLEKELQLLTNNNKEWEAKYALLENKYAAANSHVHQLQTLVKEQETIIESLKIENKLSKPNVKDIDKKTTQSLQKECDMLRKHICLAKNIVFGNMKLSPQHRLLLKKYDKYDRRNKYDSLFGEESNDEYASDEIPLSPFSEDYVDEADLSKITKLQNLNARRKESNSLELFRIPSNSLNECNDLVSIDTGRGSSRACSGSDKCFQSPDYFNDDNISCDDPVLDKIKIKLVDSTTSPIPGPVTIHVATSPINFHHPVIDRGVSPIIVLSTTHRNDTVVKKCATNSIVPVSPQRKITIESNNTIECAKTRKEKECLELNNSENICNESSNDCEIEMILSTMRLDSKMITPIPPTPAKRSDNRAAVYRTPRKKQKHLENDNTAKYHTRPLNIEQNINDSHTVKLQNRLFLVLNEDGSYVIFNNQIPSILPSNNESSEKLSKYLPILTNNDAVKVGDNDVSINVPSNNRNTNNLHNDIVITMPDKPKRANQNNALVETNTNVKPVAMDVDDLASCNNQSIENNDSNGINEIPHPHGSIAMLKLNKPIMVTDNVKFLKIDNNVRLVETLSDDELIVMDEDYETRTVSNSHALVETVNVDVQTITANEPMTVDNDNDSIETENERIITDKDKKIIVTPNKDGIVTVSNNYRLLENLNDEPIVTESHNKTIETRYTSKAMTVDNNRFIETCRDNELTVTVKDNVHVVKPNDHKTMTVGNKYRLFEDDDVTNKDKANNHRTTVVSNNCSLFGDYSDDGSIGNDKDECTVVSLNHGVSNVHNSLGISGNDRDDHDIVTNKDDEIVLPPKNNGTTITTNNYELLGNLSEDELSDKDINTAVSNKCDDISDHESILAGNDNTTITMSNNHRTTAVGNKNSLTVGKVTTDNSNGAITMHVNQATSTIYNNYVVIETDSDVRQMILEKKFIVKTLSDEEPMIMDGNSETISTPISPGTTTVDNNYSVAESLSEERAMILDKSNDIISTPNIHGTSTSDSNCCVAETLGNEGAMIMDKNNEIISTPIIHVTTTSDNNVAEALSDEGTIIIDKNNEIISTPIEHVISTSDNNCCVAETLSEEEPMIMDKSGETISTPITPGTTTVDNNYCVTECHSDEEAMIIHKNKENISKPITPGTTTVVNNYCVTESHSDEEVMIIDKNKENISMPITPGTTTVVDNYCVAEIHSDEEPMIMYENCETISPPIPPGTTTVDNNYSVAESLSEEGAMIMDKSNEIISTPNIHVSTTSDINYYVAKALNDEGAIIMDKNKESISTPITPGTTTVDNNYCVAERHSDEEAMIMDKNMENISTSITPGTTAIDNSCCVTETLSDEGPIIIGKTHEPNSTPMKQGIKINDNSYCVSDTVSDEVSMMMGKHYKAITTPNTMGPTAHGNNYVIADTLSDEGQVTMDKTYETTSTPLPQEVTIKDGNYCVSNMVSDEVSMMTGKNCKVITTTTTKGPTAHSNNCDIADTLIAEGQMIMKDTDETISKPIKQGFTTNDNKYCVSDMTISDKVSKMTGTNCVAIKTLTKQRTTAYGNNYCIAETFIHKGPLLTNKDNETNIFSNTNYPSAIERINRAVIVHESGNEDNININRDTTVGSIVCKSDEKKLKTKKQSPRSRRKSSLFCVMEELSNDNIQKDLINTVNRIEKKMTKLQSETVKSTVNVIDKDQLSCDVNTDSEINTETTAGGMSNDYLSAPKTDEGKLVKTRKSTKLGKLKQKLLPKYKIKREHLPLKRSVKLTEIIHPNKKMIVTEADSSATLNNKEAYEKAVQVVRELRRKKSISDNSNEVVPCTKTSEKKSRIGEAECIEKDETTESDCVLLSQISTPIQINTRSRRKVIEQSPINNTSPLASEVKSPTKDTVEKCVTGKDLTKSPESKKQLKRMSEDTPSGIPRKRFLRNSTCDKYVKMEPKIILSRFEDPVICTSISNVNCKSTGSIIGNFSPKAEIAPKKIGDTKRKSSREASTKITEQQGTNGSQNISDNPKNSILCQMIQRYGVKTVNLKSKKVPDTMASSIAKKIEDGISRIIELPTNETKDAMNKFVGEILNWNMKDFLAGLIKYLKDPQRRNELYGKIIAPSVPALTKAEQILLYVVSELKVRLHPVDIVDKILNCMEYTLFALNRTPQFEVIESISHLYAVICRYFKMKTRLRLFILDAMYCIQFKAVPLIRQCIEVWMHILPLAHMASAKTPLVTCLVYLLHFYKCEDKFNRVQDIRTLLQRKYFYNITEWNEIKILELFRNSITSLRGFPTEVKMLRIALIILAKRQGPRWCQNNIIKNILQPIIETKNCSEHIKAFCLSMLGPLLKPFPADMKVHCEIVMNQLITMLQENPSPIIAEGIVTSLVYLSKHSQYRVIQALILWRPQKISQELEVILKDFVKSNTLKFWKSTLSRVAQ